MDLCRETVWDTPNDGTQYAKLEEADHVYDFLAGLNPKFDTVCGYILGQRPLPSLMEVCFEVRLEEDRTNAMGVLTIPTIDSAAFSACTPRISVGHSTVVPQEVRNSPSTRNKTQDVPTLVKLPLPALLNQLVLQRARPRLRLWVPLLSQVLRNTLSLMAYAGNEKIRIAERSLAPIASKGQIVSFDGFALQNVLHVPKLSYNLLSISKITLELHCKVIFLTESVYFLDMSSGRTIGTARHIRGLYILDDDTSCSSLSRTKIAILRSDNGREFQNHNLSEFLASKGVVHQTSCACTPQQNGVAERKNRYLVEVARSLMLSTSLPSYLWGDAILIAAHLINRMPSRILHLQTPLDCLKESYPSTRLVSEVPLHVFWCTAYVYDFGPNQTKFTPRAQACVFVGHLQRKSVNEESNNTFEFIEPTPSTVSDVDPHPIILPTNQVPWKAYYRRNLRNEVGSPNNQPSTPVQDFEPPRDQGMENPTEPCTNNMMSENDRYDVAVLENLEEKTVVMRLRAFTTSLDSTIIPKNIYTALECPEWKNAVMEEMKALDKNRTWEICALPKGHKTVGCKWVFSLKYKADGTLDRHKARLVAKGFTQTYDIDYLDVKNAFLNGNLVEEVYMSPRQDLKPNLVSRFTTFVKSQGYSQGHFDHTLFTKVSKTGKIVILIVYVDDIVLTGDDQTEISQLKQRMGDEFEIKDLGNLKYFLGMEVARSKEGIPVSRRKYTLDLLTETVMLGCRPADTPIEFNCKLGNSDDQVPVDKEQYQRLVAAISIANNPIQHDRTKHIEIDWHFIKERLDSRSICIPYIPSSQQVADVLTKGLLRPHFDLCVSKLGLIDIYVPT
ncbi:Retrovirus-related Pol polyprotein from transposon TNT 1-94 [Cucumis melo var. makuwa]|uniref:Retrovirus-related Pol polyprotein from transposon TNT 1-94 n=1 Tax=Cucumis melo var. makuwa TaxID=1194695 RepID=A0A5A7UVH3_CUCMM|nr:Retrovirus-related Pol polyprotein from transposon TNT 1-94 [Cucumis melo var. makuwa]